MAKRTYNRRGRQTAKTPVRNDGRGRVQRQKAAEVARDTGSKDRVTRGRGVPVPLLAQLVVHKVQPLLRSKVLAPCQRFASRNTPATKTQTGPKTPGTMLRGANTVRNVGTNC